jgi:SRSO17 transposase
MLLWEEHMDTPGSTITVDTVRDWAEALTEVDQRIGSLFARAEARQRALAYLQGLLSPAERKNSWQLAEIMGDTTPYGFQHLLGRADWDADALRDAVQTYIMDHLSDAEAILVLDETGFLKKGQASAGVARQSSGTAGRIENCQIGVFLTYVSRFGHTLLDRELYLPREWTSDPARCQRAGVPPTRRFATKPALARQMLERVFAAHVPVRWITGDSIYGDDRRLRIWLEEQERAYVLGVSGKEYVWIGWRQHQIKQLLAQLPDQGWARLSAGDGAKGPRWYDWLRVPIGSALQEAGRRWLLVRRSPSDATDLTAYVAFAPSGTPLEEVVRVAGSRWAVEVDFEAAKSEVGLDQYEVRTWTGWYRHITLAMWAQAVLTVVRADANAAAMPKKGALPGRPPGSLARFKARRGLGSG